MMVGVILTQVRYPGTPVRQGTVPPRVDSQSRVGGGVLSIASCTIADIKIWVHIKNVKYWQSYAVVGHTKISHSRTHVRTHTHTHAYMHTSTHALTHTQHIPYDIKLSYNSNTT